MKKPYPGAYVDLLAKYKILEAKYDVQNDRYRDQLLKTAILQNQIDELERVIYFYKTVDKEHRVLFGAI